jgi:eukaryotic-like serine/threonine-protein kinase
MVGPSVQNDPTAADEAEHEEWGSILRGVEALGRRCDRLARRCRRLKAAWLRAKQRLRAGRGRDGRPEPGSGARSPSGRAGGGDGLARSAIPGYTILGLIRDGAMGRVYRARQERLGRVVAIKVLHAELARHPEYVRRFRREARLAARLAHPHIAAAFDAGRVDDRPYLVMEYARGETIQDRLDRHQVFGEREAIAIARDVAEALGHARRRGLVHRDVKPANLILTDEGIKLIDWGLARRLDDGAWATSEAGSAVGTPQYISPEQVRGQVDLDIRGDIYGLGATVYHMVTGRVPYGGDTTAEAIQRHTDPKVPLVPPDAIRPGLSGRLGAVIGKMMARNREERYRHPDDLILDLDCLLRGDRPLLAEPSPDALSPLAGGAARPAGPVRGAASVATSRALPSGHDGADRRWIVLVAVPAVVLAVTLLGTVAFLAAG